jgi:hypothetical protein
VHVVAEDQRRLGDGRIKGRFLLTSNGIQADWLAISPTRLPWSDLAPAHLINIGLCELWGVKNSRSRTLTTDRT